MTLFDFEREDKIKTETKLTPRQWKLYDFLKKQKNEYRNQESMLEAYEDWLQESFLTHKYSYGYFDEKALDVHYSDMTSGRNFRKDLRALRLEPTIQKVICQKKIAETVEEAETYLEKKLNKILRELKIYHAEKKKLEKHLQTRLVFNQEKEIIEAVRGADE